VSLPARARRVQEELHRLGLDAEVVQTPDSARTAAEAADAVGASVGRIVKSLVFLVDGAPVLALVSGQNQLDPKRLAALAGGKVERASADVVREATGFAIGGVPPVAHATELPIFCDPDLLAYDTVWAAAGTPHCVFEIAPAELVRVTGAQVADLKPDG
jgi:prolyl-tRNA editing enzyme YbaK/EbsC (Cys-tRNA(Pro) deacylase)